MLEAHDLAARRGHARLFEGLSFAVEAGHAMVVTGANGTGKTTLLRMLAGLSLPAAGQIRWDRKPVSPFDPVVRASIAFAGDVRQRSGGGRHQMADPLETHPARSQSGPIAAA